MIPLRSWGGSQEEFSISVSPAMVAIMKFCGLDGSVENTNVVCVCVCARVDIINTFRDHQ